MPDKLTKATTRLPYALTDNGDAEYPEDTTDITEISSEELDMMTAENEEAEKDATMPIGIDEDYDEDEHYNQDDIEECDF